MFERIPPQEAKRLIDEENALLVDVRESDEFVAKRIPGAVLQPLATLPFQPDDSEPERPVIYHCTAGVRTGGAEQQLQQRGHSRVYMIEGGIEAWEKAGLPVEKQITGVLPIPRQVQIAAGSLVVIFLLLGQRIPFFRLFAVFIGFGLIYAGLTGSCGLAILLKKMPWNKKN